MAKNKQRITIDVSYKTIILTLATILGLYLVFILKDVVIGLFISILVATALDPLVSLVQRTKLPRPAAILVVYSTIIGLITLIIAILVPPLISQSLRLIQVLPLNFLSDSLNSIEVNLDSLRILSSQLGTVSSVFRLVSSTFSGIVTFFTFLVITFYLLIERKHLHKHIANISPNHKSEQKAEAIVGRIEEKIGNWIRGQVILMVTIGVLTYVGLSLLGVSFALPLALIAGALEIIPNIGPTVAAIPALIIPVLVDGNPVVSIFVLAFYILLQQVENNVLVPRVMQSSAGVHPLVTIILIITGLKLAGVAGAILAVPVYLVGRVIFEELVSPLIKANWN